MIREWRVHHRYHHFGHVAGDAILVFNGTRVSRMIAPGFFRWPRDMASQAFLVVGSPIVHQLLVRIVASGAGQPRVAFAPAAAILKPVGLKARVGHTRRAHLVHVIPRPMASAAEIHERRGIQPAWIEYGAPPLLPFFRVHKVHMFRAWPVARFARHSRQQARRLESRRRSGSRRVACKAAPQSIGIDQPAERFF